MKTLLKWTLMVVILLAVVGFCAFLYFIPPFFMAAPETFSKPTIDAAPGVADIKDPVERTLAERGRYIVVTTACFACHQTPTPRGPDFVNYLGGGMKFETPHGTYVTRNLTPDTETGIARRTDDEVKRVLRSGVFPDGHVASHRLMPWGAYASWTEEDRHAVVIYLHHLKPVRHQIPEPAPPTPYSDPTAYEEVYGGKDYGVARK